MASGSFRLTESLDHRGTRRKADYRLIVKAWNLGLDETQVAFRFRIKRSTVRWILSRARTEASIPVRTIRQPSIPDPYPGEIPKPELGYRDRCEPCGRAVWIRTHQGQRVLADASIYCPHCARRWDGGLYMTPALQALLEETAEMRKACAQDPVDHATLARERMGVDLASAENADDPDLAPGVQ